MTLDVIGSGSGGEVRKVSGAAVGPAALWTTRGLTPGIGCDVTSDVIAPVNQWRHCWKEKYPYNSH